MDDEQDNEGDVLDRAHHSGCDCRACAKFRHPAGTRLSDHDLAVLEAWEKSWPHPPKSSS